MEHTFAICAYKESPYLEQCIRSLQNQSYPSKIILCTSTPNVYIENLANTYNIEIFIHKNSTGIASDWNFAYRNARTKWVTIAHQDDIYRKNYTKTLLFYKAKYPDISVFSSSSITIKKGRLMEWGKIEIIKKILRLPLVIPSLNHFTQVKLMGLRFGNPIICPSCAYNKDLCGEEIFSSDFSFVLDWETLIRLAKKKGRFIVYEKPLIFYRVHDGSETKAAILDQRRMKEEAILFHRLLPKKIANWVKKAYRSSYEAYTE